MAQIGRTDIAIARVEQLSPFPFDKVAKQTKRYPNAEVGVGCCVLSMFLLLILLVVVTVVLMTMP